MSPPYERPLLFFHASLGVSHLQAPPSIPSSVDPKAGLKGSSLELLCPSAFSGPGTLLFIPFPGRPKSFCPALRKSHPQGLATLSVISQSPNPRKPISAPHALGLPLSKLSSSIAIEEKFPSPLSALALPFKTSSALNRRSSGFLPRQKPYPLCARMD